LKQFPRVHVFNHAHLRSQGGSIAELIRQVQTDEFVYLHADVFLPHSWYESMTKNLNNFDWFECPQRLTVLHQFWNDPENAFERAYSGAQMGKTKVMLDAIRDVQDDYLQRNEDIILAELVAEIGGRYGRVLETFHFHQVMNRKGEMEPKFSKVTVQKQTDVAWERRIYDMQWKGIVKYLRPNKPYLIREVRRAISQSVKLGGTTHPDVVEWVRSVNPVWLSVLETSSFRGPHFKLLRDLAQRFWRKLKD